MKHIAKNDLGLNGQNWLLIEHDMNELSANWRKFCDWNNCYKCLASMYVRVLHATIVWKIIIIRTNNNTTVNSSQNMTDEQEVIFIRFWWIRITLM